MVEYVGESMIVDTRKADGGAYFEREFFAWRPRDEKKSQYNITIRYEDIQSIIIMPDIKKRVEVTLKNGTTYNFYLYKAATFVELINAGREAAKNGFKDVKEKEGIIDAEVEPVKELGQDVIISDEDIDRLFKINQLHKDGILDDKQFEIQKNEVMKKYQK